MKLDQNEKTANYSDGVSVHSDLNVQNVDILVF